MDDDDIDTNEVHSSNEEITTHKPVVTQKARTRKWRLAKGMSTSSDQLWWLTNLLVDNERFKGDDTLGGYSGKLKEFLSFIQQFLRAWILCEDAFPKSIDFEKTIKSTFEAKAQEAFEARGESKLVRKFAKYLLIFNSYQRKTTIDGRLIGTGKYLHHT